MESLTARPAIAIVIPARGDRAPLAALLGRIRAWHDGPAEIVVVAAPPAGETAQICAAHACRCIEVPANRGAQLDRGARATTAPILWFLHADADPPEAALATIRAAIGMGAAGGCLRFEFQGARTWLKRVLERLIEWRIRCGGIAYGDQGLFAARAAYLGAGGFAHEPLFEEAPLVRGLRRQGPFRMLATPIRVATRRWERDGWWRRTWHNRWLALCYACGVPPRRLAESYHRPDSTPRMEP